MLPLEHLELAGAAGVAHRHADQEAVELGLGQRKRPLVLDRVLRGEDDEWLGQRVGHAVDGDLALLHRFQQRGLGLRRGAVDLVGEDELGHDGPRPVLEAAGLLVEDVDPGHVAGQEIGGELDALEGAADRARDRLGQDRLADAGDVLDQDVTAAEQGDEHEEHFVPLADDHSLDVVADQARDTLDSSRDPSVDGSSYRVSRRRRDTTRHGAARLLALRQV